MDKVNIVSFSAVKDVEPNIMCALSLLICVHIDTILHTSIYKIRCTRQCVLN